MTTAHTAAEFFDQMLPVDDVSHSVPAGWCARHWAPATLPGANGVGATQDMLTTFIADHCPPNMKSRAMFRRQLASAGAVCCRLGDERMYSVWAGWPPAAASRAPSKAAP